MGDSLARLGAGMRHVDARLCADVGYDHAWLAAGVHYHNARLWI